MGSSYQARRQQHYTNRHSKRRGSIPEQAEQPIIDALEDAGHAGQRRGTGKVLAWRCFEPLCVAAVLAKLAGRKRMEARTSKECNSRVPSRAQVGGFLVSAAGAVALPPVATLDGVY